MNDKKSKIRSIPNDEEIQKMKILAIIPARGGSKSVPKKNIRLLAGHPLIAYSIAIAKMSKLINRVIVSTDYGEIAQTAKQYGAEVPFLRPAEFATDKSLDIEWYSHALGFLEKNEGYIPDLVVHLAPPAPLREAEVVDNAIRDILSDSNATSLRSARPFEFAGYKLFKMKNGYCEFFGREDFPKQEYYDWPRQALPATYAPNGYVDVIIPKKVRETGSFHGKRIRPFMTEKTADIDEMADFEYAKKIVSMPRYKPLLEKVEELKKGRV